MIIKKLAEHQKYVGITGYRNAKIPNVEQFLERIKEKTDSATVQFLNAELVAGWEHLFFAVLNALTAFKNKRNFAKSLAVEILVFASSQRQIKQAFKLLGITPKVSRIALIIIEDKPERIRETAKKISEVLKALEDDSVLEITEKKCEKIRKAFNISDEELNARLKGKNRGKALAELVIEHMALLATQH